MRRQPDEFGTGVPGTSLKALGLSRELASTPATEAAVEELSIGFPELHKNSRSVSTSRQGRQVMACSNLVDLRDLPLT